MQTKLAQLREILEKIESGVIAFSGGTDSSLLLWVARDVLSKRVIAVTADSPIFPRREFELAKNIARDWGVRHEVVETRQIQLPEFFENSPERCYFCKREIMSKIQEIAGRLNYRWVMDGSNQDDWGDFRPGMKALREIRVRSPLSEAGFTKEEIREISRQLDLPTWNKLSESCLASRIPYGQRITPENLLVIEKGEEILYELGFRKVRVRHYGATARIEVFEDELERFEKRELREKVVREFKGLGYVYVTLDLEGYRSGSLNEVLG